MIRYVLKRLVWMAVTLLLAGTVEIVSAARTVELTPDTFTEKVAAMRLADGTLVNGYTFQLAPGHYYLDPQAYVDSTCGNCDDPLTPVAATVGLHVSGRRISIEGKGEEPGDVVIHTGAGYGLLFRGCEQCRISNVTITGGVRDPDANATDAAIVVQDSQVHIENCVIRDNLGDSTVVAQTVVGIMGISGRESAVLTIKNNRIIRNSWDGIALYRGARASISNNLIDGVDKAAGAHLGGGRGVGIGLTWNARANIQYNRVTRYWKGIGVFVDAEATIQENVIEEIVTWGVAYWDGGRGRPVLNMTRNVIFDTGACGIAITRESGGEPMAGYCRENVVFHTGQNPK